MDQGSADEQSLSDVVLHVKQIDRSHPGVTCAYSDAICEAAAVCLDRHFTPPRRFLVKCDGQNSECLLHWDVSTRRAKNCRAYDKDATKDGAYAISFLCIERWLNLVAIGQAETATGSDWYLAPPGCGYDSEGIPDLDDPRVFRLEASGQDTRSTTYRTTLKTRQILAGRSSIPGITSVVGFERSTVTLACVSTEKGVAE